MDKLVQKRVIHAGRGPPPEFPAGARVTFHFRTETTDGTVIDDTRRHQPMELLLGKQFKLEVLEASVKTLALGEVAEFTVDKALLHTYPIVLKTLRDTWDPAGKPAAPAGGHCCGMMMAGQQPRLGYPDLDALLDRPQTLRITLELLKVDPPGGFQKDAWAMDEEERLASVSELRERGNATYRGRDYQAASQLYLEALGRLESLMLREKPGDEEWTRLNELKLPLLLNYAQCRLLLEDYYPVIEHCSTVLESRPDDVKALYRRGRAQARVWNGAEARADLQRAAQLDPSLSGAVRRELADLAARQRQKKEEEKTTLQGKMFQ